MDLYLGCKGARVLPHRSCSENHLDALDYRDSWIGVKNYG